MYDDDDDEEYDGEGSGWSFETLVGGCGSGCGYTVEMGGVAGMMWSSVDCRAAAGCMRAVRLSIVASRTGGTLEANVRIRCCERRATSDEDGKPSRRRSIVRRSNGIRNRLVTVTGVKQEKSFRLALSMSVSLVSSSFRTGHYLFCFSFSYRRNFTIFLLRETVRFFFLTFSNGVDVL